MHWKMGLAVALTALVVSSSQAVYGQSKDSKSSTTKPEPKKSVVSGGSKYLQGVKDLMEATDDEWKVLEPKIMKIRALLKEVDAAIEDDGPKKPKLSKTGTLYIDPNRQSDIQERSEQLALMWFEPNTPLYMLRSQIAAMNASREKIRQQLALTRAELRDLVTIRQEGVLVILGLLE